MRIAIVIQRFGTDIVGGAESHARLLAERLARQVDFKVTVLTTTSKSHIAWKNDYKSGNDKLGEISVLRFKVKKKSRIAFGIYKKLAFPLLCKLPLIDIKRWLEKFWIVLQGPFSPDLKNYIASSKSDYDCFIFFTYLYYPTQFSLKIVKEKAVLIPTAHDEAPFYFQITKHLLSQARLILVNSQAEKRLVAKVVPSNPNLKILGIGFDMLPIKSGKTDLKKPFLLYLGRVGPSKSIQTLIEYFNHYISESGSPQHLDLVMCGQLESGFTMNHPRVKFLGQVSENTKIELLEKALAVVNPSAHESLSMLALEAFGHQKPVILNLECNVFQDYNQAFPSVFGYKSAEDFCQQVDTVVRTLDSIPCGPARSWVEANYSWEAIEKTLLKELKVFETLT